MKFLKQNLLLLFLIVISITFSYADDEKNFSDEVYPSKLSVKAGEEFNLYVTLKFNEGWYTYSLKEQIGPDGIGPTQTEFFFENEEDMEISGDIRASKSKVKYDKGFEMDVETYYSKVTFEIPVKAKKDLDFQTHKINIGIFIQQCTNEKCLPPTEFKSEIRKEPFAGEFTVASVEKEVEEKAEPASSESEDEVANTDEDEDKGLLAIIIASLIAGLASILMPCVYPMIPITVSFFMKRAEQTKGKGLRDALVYAIGIIFAYTFIGFIVSLIFGASGMEEFAKKPGVYLFIAALFIFFAFSLFGAYELQLPTSWMNKLDSKSRTTSGLISVLLMSLTFTIASFSCVGPIVGSNLLLIASGKWFYPIISMFFLSAALAFPFFLLALIPSALSSMPHSGGWMNNIKTVLGFIVIGTSLYFLNNAFTQWGIDVLSRELFIAILAAISILITLYILGIFKFTHDSPVDKVGSVRIIFAMIFATLTFYLVSGLFGKPLGELETFLPASDSVSMVSGQGQIQKLSWYDNYDEALAAAKKENKSIFIDFTGKTCTNCKKMEKLVFPKQAIHARLEKLIRVKLITDVNEEPYISNKEFQKERFNTVAIPLYVIITPDDKVLARTAYTDDEEKFAGFLDKGL